MRSLCRTPGGRIGSSRAGSLIASRPIDRQLIGKTDRNKLLANKPAADKLLANKMLAAAALAVLASGSIVSAQTSSSWVVDADGSWSQAANWSGGVPDAGGVATFFTLPVFTTAPRNITLDLPSVTLGGITYDSPFTYNLRLPTGNTTNTITLTGAAEIRHNSDSNNGWNLTTNGQLFGIPISGTSGLKKTGPGTVSITATNTYTGGTSIAGGILRITTGDRALGDASGDLTFNDGTLRTATGAFNSARTINLAGDGTLETTATGAATLSGAITGGGVFTKTGSAILALTGSSSYTGATFIASGSLLISANGSITATPAIAANGTITLDNVATNLPDRIGDTAGITFTGSGLVLNGNAAGSGETIGAATLGSGVTTIGVTPSASGGASITFGAVSRVNGGAAFFRGPSLGASPGIGVGNVYFTAAPSLVGAGGADGSTSVSIIPWAYGSTSATAVTTGTLSGLVTYGANGVRPLDLSTEYVSALAAATATDNVRLTTSQTLAGPQTVAALVLGSNGGASITLGGSDALSITSGVILNTQNGNVVAAPIDFGAAEGIVHAPLSITFSGPISGSGGLTKTSIAAATFASAASTYTGVTTLGGGTNTYLSSVGSGVPSPFGSDTSAIVLAGGDFCSVKLVYGGSGPATFERGLVNRSLNAYNNTALIPQFGVSSTQSLTMNGDVHLDFPLAVTGAAGGTVTFNGKISGPWFLTETSSTVTTILNGDNDFTGGVELNGGQWGVGSDSAFGTGIVKMIALSATPTIFAVGGPRIVPNDIVQLTLSTTYWTIGGSNDITFTGRIPLADLGTVNGTEAHVINNTGLTTYAGTLSIGGLNKTGAGTLVLSGDNDYNGVTTITTGTLRVTSSTGLGSNLSPTTILSGGALELANNAQTSEPVTTNGTGLANQGAIRSISGNNAVGAVTVATNTTIGVESGVLLTGNIGASGAGTAGLTKIGGGQLSVERVRVGDVSIDAGTIAVNLGHDVAKTSRIAALSVAPGAALDLGENNLIATNTPVATVTGLIASARNGGAWDGSGVTSVAARIQPSHSTTLGVLNGGEYTSVNSGTFDTFAVASTDTLVKYTWYGDTDLNGLVNFDDYVRTDNGFNNALTGWLNGDFDYNGVVNFDDYVLIDLAFNTQSGTLGRALAFLDGSDRSLEGMSDPALQKVADHFGQFGEAYAHNLLSAVPEPIALPVLAAAGALLAVRRRRSEASKAPA